MNKVLIPIVVIVVGLIIVLFSLCLDINLYFICFIVIGLIGLVYWFYLTSEVRYIKEHPELVDEIVNKYIPSEISELEFINLIGVDEPYRLFILNLILMNRRGIIEIVGDFKYIIYNTSYSGEQIFENTIQFLEYCRSEINKRQYKILLEGNRVKMPGKILMTILHSSKRHDKALSYSKYIFQTINLDKIFNKDLSKDLYQLEIYFNIVYKRDIDLSKLIGGFDTLDALRFILLYDSTNFIIPNGYIEKKSNASFWYSMNDEEILSMSLRDILGLINYEINLNNSHKGQRECYLVKC